MKFKEIGVLAVARYCFPMIAVVLCGCSDRLLWLVDSHTPKRCAICEPDATNSNAREDAATGAIEIHPVPEDSVGRLESPPPDPTRLTLPGTLEPTLPIESKSSTADSLKPAVATEHVNEVPKLVAVPTIANHGNLDPSAGPVVAGDYLVRPGDNLEILFSEDWKPGAEYRLLAGDEIHIEFLSRPEVVGSSAIGLDRSIRIQPDGRIAMPFLGVLEVAGRTVGELADLLSTRYARLYVDPRVHVTLVSTGEGFADLREAMRSVSGRAASVASDGTITLPYIGRIPVAGLNRKEIEDELNERYSLAVPGFAATVRLVGRQ